jgi:hypothetical protein
MMLCWQSYIPDDGHGRTQSKVQFNTSNTDDLVTVQALKDIPNEQLNGPGNYRLGSQLLSHSIASVFLWTQKPRYFF